MKNPEHPSRSRAIISSDDPQLQFLAQIAVEAAGFDVVEVGPGAENWSAMSEESFDLLISCTSSPEPDDLSESAAPTSDDVSISWPSSLGLEAVDGARAQSEDASTLEKPFTLGDLLDAVKRSNDAP